MDQLMYAPSCHIPTTTGTVGTYFEGDRYTYYLPTRVSTLGGFHKTKSGFQVLPSVQFLVKYSPYRIFRIIIGVSVLAHFHSFTENVYIKFHSRENCHMDTRLCIVLRVIR